MALQKTVDLNVAFGLNHTFTGYFAIQSVAVERNPEGNRLARTIVLVFASKQAKDAGFMPVTHDQDEFVFNAADNTNLFTLAYNHLKTLPRYAGAVDA